MSPLFLVVLAILIIALIPRWPYSLNWGYGPSGLLGIILVVLLILLLLGRI
jgi:hypothetical protein